MVDGSREAKNDFNNFSDDDAILWADAQIESYKNAMLSLARSHSDWAMSVSDDDERLIDTMIRRAEEYSKG